MTQIDSAEVHFHKGINESDNRGSFTKFWTHSSCNLCLNEFQPKEAFFSTSSKGVIRGFHFQKRPRQISKIVKVLSGRILDVSFPVFPEIELEFRSYVLDAKSEALYIPKNFAHAFQVISDEATVLYLTDGGYSKELDSGIHWTSYSKWEHLSLTISERDFSFPCIPGISKP